MRPCLLVSSQRQETLAELLEDVAVGLAQRLEVDA